MAGMAYENLDRRWKEVCRVLFEGEIGGLGEFSEWLSELNEPILHKRSSLSGKSVSFAVPDYCQGAALLSFDEVDINKKFQPLSINEAKDIDSIVQAVQERIFYTGNIILGNSNYIEKSSNISDSFYMLESAKLGDSKYIGYSTLGRLDEYCFGNNGIGETSFAVRCYETFRDKRCFELWMGQNCSDCYYSHALSNCSECFFSFHLKDRRHAIGNLELPREKYLQVKSALLEQMREKLKKEKRLPSLVEIVSQCGDYSKELALLAKGGIMQVARGKGDKKPIEQAFSRTSGLLLGKQLEGGVDRYSGWLSLHTRRTEKQKSALSGLPVFRGDYCCYFRLPKDRLVTMQEGRFIGDSVRIGKIEAEGITLENAHRAIGKIAYFVSEYEEGTNLNTIECATTTDSTNCYRSFPIVYSKNCAYSFWPRSSEYAFGCESLFDSQFCMNAYYSSKIRGGFELDSCRDCANLYFSHNCENVQDSMFCFNLKNARYAIGNAPLPRVSYLKIKEKITGEIYGELSAKCALGIDIYNIGCGKRKHGY